MTTFIFDIQFFFFPRVLNKYVCVHKFSLSIFSAFTCYKYNKHLNIQYQTILKVNNCKRKEMEE